RAANRSRSDPAPETKPTAGPFARGASPATLGRFLPRWVVPPATRRIGTDDAILETVARPRRAGELHPCVRQAHDRGRQRPISRPRPTPRGGAGGSTSSARPPPRGRAPRGGPPRGPGGPGGNPSPPAARTCTAGTRGNTGSAPSRSAGTSRKEP